LKCFYPTKFKVDNYQKGTKEYIYWHPKIACENLKKEYEQYVIDSGGHTPCPKKGYET
jgi:hypothetical protein